MATVLATYRKSLAPNRRVLLDRLHPVDVALKVVGVGSVGTRCWIVLLEGRDRDDPVFLQVKEAGRSVLEDHLPRSPYRHPGRRVVEGQQLMQASRDIFLGWTTGPEGRAYYVRQLRDGKVSVNSSRVTAAGMRVYAELCGQTLARAHARSGDAVAIAAYLGSGDASTGPWPSSPRRTPNRPSTTTPASWRPSTPVASLRPWTDQTSSALRE